MACKDKKKDAKIIAEVNRRKASRENKNINPAELIVHGDLLDILSTIDQKTILQITNQDHESWIISFK